VSDGMGWDLAFYDTRNGMAWRSGSFVGGRSMVMIYCRITC
jgi:hypothetical protein